MQKIAIVDYGMGNLHSVTKAFELVADGRAQVELTADPAVVAAADKVVFPGQGAMPDCMRHLEESGLKAEVLKAAGEKPFFGICVGAQLLFERSEEGPTDSLGVFKGQVVRFPPDRMIDADGNKLKVPHMGWNEMFIKHAHPLWAGIPDGERFYFVHSYHFAPADDVAVIESAYPYRFAAAVARDNIFAIQCHPEKSHRAGLQLLQNFVNWDGKA
ncbi:imidazole glycerol phosphate synthase subunit hisH [Andreprevotia lacus DSM 23236]|jgi:glutamine amidotransferase|uniref:Imidazole glycerol phosphate synthase subunit HisH n=1 Tax=Andreprevotia lacus DSM 23236 TaxID=1121001 RepID=A0A1W1XT72_9NEIS|nr:imidazole glycerol phosphate synthase subunit HisH [Andreprevotia lacus]SMC27064.1 imidazole glycerol phosphate synthase subunit hisH [Andreprevotia lacus DSM 23236]